MSEMDGNLIDFQIRSCSWLHDHTGDLNGNKNIYCDNWFNIVLDTKRGGISDWYFFSLEVNNFF